MCIPSLLLSKMKETIEYNTMKKFSFLFLSVFLLAFTGCNRSQNDEDEINSIIIEAVCDSNGTVTPLRAEVSLGSKTDFVVTPAEGCYIDKVTVDGKPISVTSSNIFSIVASSSSNQKVKVSCKKKEALKSVMEVINTSNCTITPSRVEVIRGTVVDFVVTPIEGYYIDKVTVNNKSFSVISDTLSIFASDSSMRVDVSCKVILKKFNISTSCGPNGSMSPSGKLIVTEGENITFTFQPEECFEMNTLKLDGVEVPLTSSLTLTNVTSNINVEVTFKKDSILWLLENIVWRLDSTYLCNKKGEILSSWYEYDRNFTKEFLSNGVSTETVDGKTIYPSWSIDRSTSPTSLIINDSYRKIEILNDKKMVYSYKEGEYCLKKVYVNERYK